MDKQVIIDNLKEELKENQSKMDAYEDKQIVIDNLKEELKENQSKMDAYMISLHDALLRLTTQSIKDLSAAIMRCQDEARRIQICLVALKK